MKNEWVLNWKKENKFWEETRKEKKNLKKGKE